MSPAEIVVGLDIGTTKVCTVIGQSDARGDVNVIGVGVVPSRGIKKGVVVDVGETTAAIKDATERAGHMAGVQVRRVLAGITGEHIQSINRRGTVTVASPDFKVSRLDVERVLQAAALEVPLDREVVHSLPREYVLDGQRGVRRPIGLAGQRLEVETHIVTAGQSLLRNVAQCVEGAGLQVEALVLEPIATAEAVLTGDEREMGVVLIDIGGGTSDIAVFVDGSIIYTGVLPVGGNHVTRDIAIGLRTPFEIAERLKIERGAASSEMIPHGEALEVLMAGTGERLRIPRSVLGEIIEARMSELFEMAQNAILSAGMNRPVPAGLVLSGGGALLPGVMDLASRAFSMPVRLGKPAGITGWTEAVATPQYATAAGLCRYAARHRLLSHGETRAPENAPQRRVWGLPVPAPASAVTSLPGVTPAHLVSGPAPGTLSGTAPGGPSGTAPGAASGAAIGAVSGVAASPDEGTFPPSRPVNSHAEIGGFAGNAGRGGEFPAGEQTAAVPSINAAVPASPAPQGDGEWESGSEVPPDVPLPLSGVAEPAPQVAPPLPQGSAQPPTAGRDGSRSVFQVAAAQAGQESPFDRIRRRDEMLAGVAEPGWKKLWLRVKQLIGFESS